MNKKALIKSLLMTCSIFFAIDVEAQNVIADTLYINNMIDFRAGLFSPVSNNVNPFIYRSKDANTTYPFNQNGNLVLQTRTSANRDIVFMAGSPTAVPVMNITSAGDVGIGTMTPSQSLHVNGSMLSNGDIYLQAPAQDAGDLIFKTSADLQLGRIWTNTTNISGLYLSSGDNIADIAIIDNGNVGLGKAVPISKFHVYSNNSEVSNGTGITIEQEGTGDAQLQYLLSGVQRWVSGIDNSDENKFIIGRGADWIGGKDFVIRGNGNVGIGTTTPNAKLQVTGTGNFGSDSDGIITALRLQNDDLGTNAGASIDFDATTLGGTNADAKAQLIFSKSSGFNTTLNRDTKLEIMLSSDGAMYKGLHLDGDSDGGYFAVSPGGTEKLRIEDNGNVGIGTTTPDNKLEVNGTIRAKEIKVEATNWPDYVFEESYTLPSLAEIEAFIKANKHLPEVPSAKEVEENGIALGKMNTLLLKKIEELTLHTIEQQKALENKQQMIDELELGLSIENSVRESQEQKLKTLEALVNQLITRIERLEPKN